MLPEWKEVGHLIVDYRAMFKWASRVEVLYATAQISAATAEATAEIAKAGLAAAQERERVALAQYADERRRTKRLAWLAGALGGLAVVVGGVAVGVGVAR